MDVPAVWQGQVKLVNQARFQVHKPPARASTANVLYATACLLARYRCLPFLTR